jgi:quinol monooxygenase YgiN
MHILRETSDYQTIKLIPRRENVGVVTISLTNKSTRTEEGYLSFYYWQTTDVTFNAFDEDWNDASDVEFTYGTTFSTIYTNEFNIKEGNYYILSVNDEQGEIYRGLIFCTNQTDFDKFNVSKDDYVVETSYDNEYIIL